MPYVMGGFPDDRTAAAVAAAYAETGADLVEVGVPFSDPLADGPVIHDAATRALANGATFERSIAVCEALGDGVPAIVMCLREHGPGDGLEALRRPARGRRRSGRDRARPSARGGRRDPRRPRPPRASRWRRSSRRRLRTTGGARSAPRPRASSTSSRSSASPASATACRRSSRQTSRPRAPTPRSRWPSASGSRRPAQVAEVGRIADGVIVASRLVREVGDAADADSAARVVGSFLRDARAAIA